MSLGSELLSATTGDFVRPVPCPELPVFDGKVFVRKVSAKELDDVTADDSAANYRARSAVLFACDASGTRLWRNDQADAVGAKAELLFLVERINHAGRLHNGLTEESRTLTEKNSVGGEASGSPVSSA